MNNLISIIIPCKEIDDYAKECVEGCKQLNYESYEVILLPDDTSTEIDGVNVISTGPVTPGAKRNVGIANSNGEICAFIDSDAYPRRDWLSNAINYFDNPEVVAVGGPGLTPKEDCAMQRASGYVLSSFMVGNMSNRYKAKKRLESDDIHSCNFIARKKVLEDVGGWNEKYWPGEDTLICLAMKKLGKRLIEAPDVVVYHHRKPLFKAHLRQVSRFGVHRGFFAKKYRANSLRFTYFVPSLFILSVFSGILISILNSPFMGILLIMIISYLMLCFISTLLTVKEVKLIFPVWLGIITTHVVYGASFLIGLLKRDLKR